MARFSYALPLSIDAMNSSLLNGIESRGGKESIFVWDIGGEVEETDRSPVPPSLGFTLRHQFSQTAPYSPCPGAALIISRPNRYTKEHIESVACSHASIVVARTHSR